MNSVKNILLVVGLLFLRTPVNAQSGGDRVTQALLEKQDDEWNQALLQHDLKYWGRVLSEDFLFADEKGRIWDITSFGAYTSTTYFSMIESGDRSVHVYEGFAVIVGVRKETFRQPTAADSPQTRRVAYTKVFRKHEVGWQVVAYHESRYAPL